MAIGRHTSSINIMYNGALLEHGKQFIYRGANFKRERRYHQGGEEKGSNSQKSQLRPSQDTEKQRAILPIPRKRTRVQLMIWSIVNYVSEILIYINSVQNTINVFDRRWYRRMLRISWTEHVTNEKVFNMANTKPILLDGLHKRRLAFMGHLARKGGITHMFGGIHGTRPRGRPRTTWQKDLVTQANINYKEAFTIPRDSKKWRSVGNQRRTPDE